jgi:hypothetical protein
MVVFGKNKEKFLLEKLRIEKMREFYCKRIENLESKHYY